MDNWSVYCAIGKPVTRERVEAALRTYKAAFGVTPNKMAVCKSQLETVQGYKFEDLEIITFGGVLKGEFWLKREVA